MKWSVISAISLCIMASAVLFAAAQPEDGYTLTMEGEGTVTVPADVVTISVSAESSKENMTQARAEVEDDMDRIISALKKVGVKDDEIIPGQSGGISSFQSSSNICRTVNNTTVCENSTQSASSLSRSTLVRLQTTDESEINRVLDAAEAAGADARIAGYGLIDPDEAQTEAREKALANARQNAEAIAETAGGRLGKALDIFIYPNLGMEYSYGLGGGRMVEVSSRVIVTYEFTS